jgi:manganese/zinc/iron transport system permease protein
MLFAPNRGLVWNWVRRQRSRRQLRLDAVLNDMYTLAVQHDNLQHAHSIGVLRTMNEGAGGVRRSLETLAGQGLVRESGGAQWALPPSRP